MVLQNTVLTRLDLAQKTRGLARGAVIPRGELSLQAVQPALVCAHKETLGEPHLDAAHQLES